MTRRSRGSSTSSGIPSRAVAAPYTTSEGPYQARRRARSHAWSVAEERYPATAAPASSSWPGTYRLAAIPTTWALVFFYFLSFGGFLAFTSWLPTYWHAMYGSALREAGLLTASFSLVSALIRVPGGLLSDRLSIRYALPANFVLMLAGTLVLAFSGSFWLSLGATLAVGLGMGLQNAIVFKLLPSYVPDAVGGASGWIGGLGALGGFVIPPIMGIATGLVNGPTAYARGFIPFAVLIVLSLPVVVWLTRWSARRVAVS
jgi:NNP family nitrate/nitrite transporter-like MFS transporter